MLWLVWLAKFDLGQFSQVLSAGLLIGTSFQITSTAIVRIQVTIVMTTLVCIARIGQGCIWKNTWDMHFLEKNFMKPHSLFMLTVTSISKQDGKNDHSFHLSPPLFPLSSSFLPLSPSPIPPRPSFLLSLPILSLDLIYLAAVAVVCCHVLLSVMQGKVVVLSVAMGFSHVMQGKVVMSVAMGF